MLHKNYIKCLAALLIALLSVAEASAQAAAENEYYETFPDLITTRYYLSKKYTNLRISDKEEQQLYAYKPNSTLNMGVNASYKWATLNLGYGFGFLNPNSERGSTRSLDLQAHAYPRRLVIDFFGQFYKGYYLTPAGKAALPEEQYYVRPDLRVIKIGASLQYVFNHARFSNRAAFLQNEWQKKSAGTPLFGIELYGGSAKADSVIVPQALLQDPSRNFELLRYFEIGPNAGYAYTLVFKRHLFFTASASANLGVGYTELKGETGQTTEWELNPNLFLRGSAGYNSAQWSVSASYVYNRVRLAQTSGFKNGMLTGNYMLNLAYRFRPGPKLHRYLRHIGRE